MDNERIESARTLDDIERRLIPYTQRSKSVAFTLDTTKHLAAAVGNPQDRLAVVHVAGTSGKTTTSYYVAGLLQAAGKKVGLTVSPHITSIAERVQIDGRPLDTASFVGYFDEFIDIVESTDLAPSYFEFMMVFALWVFDREGVDYAVVETGLGGMHDTSNICRRSDKVCIITDIGYDHMHILGNTLSEIAAQKAGIIAESNSVMMYEQTDEIMRAINLAVGRWRARLMLATDKKRGTYFERNFDLAKFTYDRIAERDGLPRLNDAEITTVFADNRPPGRLEKIKVKNTTFILDGAHNEQKLSALFSTIKSLYGDRRWPIILALKADKDSAAVADVIARHAAEVVVTEFRNQQDTPVRAMPAGELAELIPGARTADSLQSAAEYFLGQATPEVLLTGSFFAVAELRAWLIEQNHATIES